MSDEAEQELLGSIPDYVGYKGFLDKHRQEKFWSENPDLYRLARNLFWPRKREGVE